MRSIEQALQEVRSLHERVTQNPAPEISPQAFLPFPPGLDPISFAIEEVLRLKQLVEQSQPGTTAPQWAPRADIYAGDHRLCFVLEIPGVAKTDVEVRVVGAELVVRGRLAPREAAAEDRPWVVERPIGAFERRFPLPAWCAPEAIRARCADGVLEIQVSRSDGESSGDFRVKVA